MGEDITWVLAGYGLNGDVTEGSRPDSVCGHCVTQEWDGIEITDFFATNEFAKNPAAVFGGIRYYTSFLIYDPITSLPLGTLCVLNRAPMVGQQWQRRTLRLLARQVAVIIHLRQQISQVDDIVKNIQSSGVAITRSLSVLEEVSVSSQDVLALLTDNEERSRQAKYKLWTT